MVDYHQILLIYKNMKLKNVEQTIYTKGNKTTCILTTELEVNPDFPNFRMLRDVSKGFTQVVGISGFTGVELKVVGIAKCNPEDTYDEIYGRHLAEVRAKKKLFKLASALNRKLSIAIHSQILEELNIHANKYMKASIDEDIYITKL